MRIQTFRSNIEKLYRTFSISGKITKFVQYILFFSSWKRWVDKFCSNSKCPKFINLIFHEWNKRWNNNRYSISYHSRELIREWFSTTSRHKYKRIISVYNMLYDFLLSFTKRLKSKGMFEYSLYIFHRDDSMKILLKVNRFLKNFVLIMYFISQKSQKKKLYFELLFLYHFIPYLFIFFIILFYKLSYFFFFWKKYSIFTHYKLKEKIPGFHLMKIGKYLLGINRSIEFFESCIRCFIKMKFYFSKMKIYHPRFKKNV